MLPHLLAWQKKHGFPMQFACEATLNIAKQTEILALMRETRFVTVFAGIETPEADALKAMRKEHNNAVPMMGAIKTLNDYGLEVTSGMILGLDTDSANTESRIKGKDRGKLNWGNLRRGLSLAFNVMREVGWRSDYRRPFWRAFRYAFKRGQIDGALGMGFVAHHLIEFTREALRGEQNASFY